MLREISDLITSFSGYFLYICFTGEFSYNYCALTSLAANWSYRIRSRSSSGGAVFSRSPRCKSRYCCRELSQISLRLPQLTFLGIGEICALSSHTPRMSINSFNLAALPGDLLLEVASCLSSRTDILNLALSVSISNSILTRSLLNPSHKEQTPVH